jgi:hypothetical protein
MKVIRRLGRRLCEQRALRLPERRWSTVGLGVVVAARNRAGVRVKNFMRTLRRQTVPHDMVDVTLVDYGSEPECAAELRALCLDWRVRYCFLPVPSHLERRRSLALNIGLRQVPEWCRYVVCTDIDMLFAPNFCEWVLRTQLAYPKALTLCQFLDLPEGSMDDDTDPLAEFGRLRALGVPYEETANGPCLGAPRAWWYAIRGYDERLFGEDHDDWDIRKRARRDGRAEVWIHDHTALLHQWHWRRFETPRDEQDLPDQESYHKHFAPNAQIADHDPTIRRNLDHEWGVLPPGGTVIEPPERRR